MRLTGKVRKGEMNGSILWVCDYRQEDLHKKPIRNIKGKINRVSPMVMLSFAGSLTKPGAIKRTTPGAKMTPNNVIKSSAIMNQ